MMRHNTSKLVLASKLDGRKLTDYAKCVLRFPEYNLHLSLQFLKS